MNRVKIRIRKEFNSLTKVAFFISNKADDPQYVGSLLLTDHQWQILYEKVLSTAKISMENLDKEKGV